MGQAECKGCSASDPATDTVKVDLPGGTLLADDGDAKTSPKHQADEEQLVQLQQEEETEQEHARREAEAQRECEREREEQERQTLLAEAQRLEQERAEAQAREEQRLREEAARAEREAADRLAVEEAQQARMAEEEMQRVAEEKALKEAQQKSGAFLKSQGFKSATHPKTSCMKVSYPLHVAVQKNQADVVAALLRCGAEKQVKNKAGQTPLQVAQKLNKKGSHQAVIAVLV